MGALPSKMIEEMMLRNFAPCYQEGRSTGAETRW